MMSVPCQIAKLLPRLGDAQGSELLAVRDAIGRVLRGAGLDWHDLAEALRPTPFAPAATHRASEPSFADMARAVRDLDGGRLTLKERGFVTQMCAIGFARRPSERQRAWLASIFDRLQRRAA